MQHFVQNGFFYYTNNPAKSWLEPISKELYMLDWQLVDNHLARQHFILKSKKCNLSSHKKMSLIKHDRFQRYVWGETSEINLTEDFSEICKSALIEMSLRRWVRRLKDTSMPAGITLFKLNFDFYNIIPRLCPGTSYQGAENGSFYSLCSINFY